jgi:hypothetical protein
MKSPIFLPQTIESYLTLCMYLPNPILPPPNSPPACANSRAKKKQSGALSQAAEDFRKISEVKNKTNVSVN